MKALLVWLVIGVLAVLIETSLVFAPFLVGWLWLASKFVPWEKIIWLAAALGFILDCLLVLPLGLSSLILIGISLVFWYQRQIFTNSQVADIVVLMASLLLWGYLRGQSLWGTSIVLVTAAAFYKFFGPQSVGVTLRRMV